MSSAIATDPFASLNGGASAGSTRNTSDTASADRFLKLLVTQLQNQDPLNPMDNAQITSQMAQINTVTGIQTLNNSVEGLNAQFVQAQALQGAALVGRELTVQGNRIAINAETGQGLGGFDLALPADAVTVEILNPAGRVVETLKLGAQDAGRHDILWDAKAAVAANPDMAFSFRVSANSGATKLETTPLMRDLVQSVSTSSKGLVLNTLFNGDVAYSDVKAFN